jgi:hypothetical protein
VTPASGSAVIEAPSNATFETVRDEPSDASGVADPPDRAAVESAFEPPHPARVPAVASSTTIDALG